MTIQDINSILQEMSAIKNDLILPSLRIQDFTSNNTLTHRSLWRKGGFRVQQQIINDKHIYHNYGQGLSEFSLAYGCSYIVSKMITLKKQATKTKDVAVIGSGINAMMTALQLAKRGHKVTLYTRTQPVKKNNNIKIVPASAGYQFWYPGYYDNSDPLKHQLISKLSFQFLQTSIKQNRYQSFKECNVYISLKKSQQVLENVTQFITKNIQEQQIHFGNEKSQNYICYKSFLINTQLFIQQIFVELKLRNVEIIERQFKNLNNILLLKEQFVYNCLGIQVREIFGDNSVAQVTNINVDIPLSKQTNQVLSNFAIWKSSQMQQEDFVLFLTKNTLQVSSRYQPGFQGANDAKNREKLISKAYHFIKQRSIKPFKL